MSFQKPLSSADFQYLRRRCYLDTKFLVLNFTHWNLDSCRTTWSIYRRQCTILIHYYDLRSRCYHAIFYSRESFIPVEEDLFETIHDVIIKIKTDYPE